MNGRYHDREFITCGTLRIAFIRLNQNVAKQNIKYSSTKLFFGIKGEKRDSWVGRKHVCIRIYSNYINYKHFATMRGPVYGNGLLSEKMPRATGVQHGQ